MEIHYVFEPNISSSNLLDKRELHHLKVLRVKDGDPIRVLDGKGSLYEGILDNGKLLNLTLIKKENLGSIRVTLIQGLIKTSKSELLVQKLTELGIYKIIFVPMERSNAKLDFYFSKKRRFDKIMIDAIKQSHNLFLPKIEFHTSLDSALKDVIGKKICFYEKFTTKINLLDIFSKDNYITYVIGPEGGLTNSEVEFLKSNGFIFSSLSKNILRAETAALSALSVINYLLL